MLLKRTPEPDGQARFCMHCDFVPVAKAGSCVVHFGRLIVKHIETVNEFVASLNARQRRFFLLREQEMESHFGAALAGLGAAISGISPHYSESLDLRLRYGQADAPPGKRP